MQLEHRTAGTVLVIDDDQGMRQVLKDFLERDGHRVVEAASGEAAVSAVELESIDVVILDKEMPGMNGMEVLSFLHRRFPSTPVILVTAFGGPHVAEESFRRGAVEYIEKPFRLSNVVDRVQKLMNALEAARPSGGVSLRAEAGTRDSRVGVQFVVKDTGHGIPAALMSKIFEPFFSTKPPGEGTGLGLPICRDIVKSLDGSIGVESTPDQGTVFTVWIPSGPLE